MTPLYGLFLAGGKSTRMGQDKASLILGGDGLTQAIRGIGLLGRFCERVHVSLREGQLPPEGVEKALVIRDSDEAQGPVAGILGAFCAAPAAAWLVLACDLPFVRESLLARLVAGFRESPAGHFTAFASSRDGLPEPLCAIYGPSARSVLQRHAAHKHFCPRHIMKEENASLLSLPPEDAGALENMNTPRDLAGTIPVHSSQANWFGYLSEDRPGP